MRITRRPGRRIVGQSLGPEAPDDLDVHPSAECEFCDDPVESHSRVVFKDPPHGRNLTLPRSLIACEVCADAIRRNDNAQLEERIRMGALWPNLRGMASLVLRNVTEILVQN